jgi:hypothetical protein
MDDMICDHCGRRSPQCGHWYTCRECLENVCYKCALPMTREDETGRALCLKCAAVFQGNIGY